MTLCNMSIEGGARAGYVSPDETTFEYMRGRPYAPQAPTGQGPRFWRSIASAEDASFDDKAEIDASSIEPMVTWGTNPGRASAYPRRRRGWPTCRPSTEREPEPLTPMGFSEGQRIAGKKIDVAFIGSCTNGRISDLREAAAVAKGRKVAPGSGALVVPGSMQVAAQARKEGLDEVFSEAGFEWRFAGCSMCLAMNPDKLEGDQLCASSSNRNFIGRQGSARGRTLL